jgi:hypothetical protein
VSFFPRRDDFDFFLMIRAIIILPFAGDHELTIDPGGVYALGSCFWQGAFYLAGKYGNITR